MDVAKDLILRDPPAVHMCGGSVDFGSYFMKSNGDVEIIDCVEVEENDK